MLFAFGGSSKTSDEIECRSEEHTSELQSLRHLVCRLLLEKKKKIKTNCEADSPPAYHNGRNDSTRPGNVSSESDHAAQLQHNSSCAEANRQHHHRMRQPRH